MGVKNAFVAVGIIAVVLLFAALIIAGRGDYTYNIYNIGAALSSANEASNEVSEEPSSSSNESSSSSSDGETGIVSGLAGDSAIAKTFSKALDWFKGYVGFVISGGTLDIIVKAAFVSLLLFALSYAVQVIRVLLMGMGIFTILLAIAAILGIIG